MYQICVKQEISILEQYINTLDLPQNNNNVNNQENYPYLPKSKPKQKEKLPNIKKIESNREQTRIERANSKLFRKGNLDRSTFESNSRQMQEEINLQVLQKQDRRAYIEYLKEKNKSMGIKMPNAYYESQYFPNYQ